MPAGYDRRKPTTQGYFVYTFVSISTYFCEDIYTNSYIRDKDKFEFYPQIVQNFAVKLEHFCEVVFIWAIIEEFVYNFDSDKLNVYIIPPIH